MRKKLNWVHELRAFTAILLLSACHRYTPISTPPTPLDFRDVRHVRVLTKGGGTVDIWYPRLSGDTAIAGLASSVVTESSRGEFVPLDSVARIDRVGVYKTWSALLLVLAIPALILVATAIVYGVPQQ